MTVTETDLFKLLVSREQRDGFEAAHISSRVSLIIDEAWPVLQQVSRSFPLYTLHDPEHSYRVAQNMHRLIPSATLEFLNSVELSLLIYAAYLHDIGMASSQEEFHRWLHSPAYTEYVSSRERWAVALRNVRRSLDQLGARMGSAESAPGETAPGEAITQSSDAELRCLQDVIYTDYLRETHAARSAEYVLRRHGTVGASNHRSWLFT